MPENSKKRLSIALLGSRGIPNAYGGFEQFADVLGRGLAKRGHDVTVYCSSSHPYQADEYEGVRLVHCFDPENRIGTAGQFVYDLMSILHARRRKYDIIYLLGNTSSSIWQGLLGKECTICNMDGLEWKRSKYSPRVQRFLKTAERWAAERSRYLIADNEAIRTYLRQEYQRDSKYIPYGSDIFTDANDECLSKYGLEQYKYDMLLARFVPENNIEIALNAFTQTNVERQFVIIGNYKASAFGIEMYNRFHHDARLVFINGLYDQCELNNLRYYSNIYVHGHSVGGTNPSLIEAMGSNALIAAHNNEFNNCICDTRLSWTTVEELRKIFETVQKVDCRSITEHNLEEVRTKYLWDTIITQYEDFFYETANAL